MSRCSHLPQVQDYLDGMLEPGAARAFEHHMGGCGECRLELALYRRVFAALEGAPTFDPGPALTERVLDHVLPSRVKRQRRLAVLGWVYGGSLAVSAFAIVAAAVQPLGRAALAALWGQASHRVLGTLEFVLNTVTWLAIRAAGAGEWLTTTSQRVAPVVRGIGAVLSEPAVAMTLTAAAAVSIAVIWWMRPRERAGAKEARYVAIVGF